MNRYKKSIYTPFYKTRLMKYCIFYLLILAFSIPKVNAQESGSEIQQTTKKSVVKIESKLDSLNKEMNLLKKKIKGQHSPTATIDSLASWIRNTLVIISIVLALIALVIGIGGVSTFLITKSEINQKKKEIDDLFDSKFAAYEERFQRGLVNVNKNAKKDVKSLKRLFITERSTIMAKEQARLLFILKENGNNKPITDFRKMIEAEFLEGSEIAPVKAFDHIENTPEFNRMVKSNDGEGLNLIIMNDDLFQEIGAEKEGPYLKLNQLGEKKALPFINKLKDNNIGLAIYGKLGLKDYNIPLVAYSNERYSLYSNVNNLLKYMAALKNAKLL